MVLCVGKSQSRTCVRRSGLSCELHHFWTLYDKLSFEFIGDWNGYKQSSIDIVWICQPYFPSNLIQVRYHPRIVFCELIDITGQRPYIPSLCMFALCDMLADDEK